METLQVFEAQVKDASSSILTWAWEKYCTCIPNKQSIFTNYKFLLIIIYLGHYKASNDLLNPSKIIT